MTGLKVLAGSFHYLMTRPVITAILFSTILLFWLFDILNILSIPVHPTVYRITYYSTFRTYILGNTTMDYYATIVLSLALAPLLVRRLYIILPIITGYLLIAIFFSNILQILAIVTLPSILGFIIIKKREMREVWKGITIYGLSAFVALEAVSVIIWITLPLFPSKIFSEDIRWIPVRAESMLFLAIGDLSPFVAVLLVYSFILKRYRNTFSKFFKAPRLEGHPVEQKKPRDRAWVILLIFMVLGILLTFYPYIRNINANNQAVGTDILQYTQHLDSLINSNSIADVLSKAFVSINGGDRPLTLLLLYASKVISGADSIVVVTYFPSILTPLMLITEYLFLKSFTNNTKTITITLGFTFFSAQFLVGIYAAFYANWLAICLTYLSFFFLQRFMTNRKFLDIVLFGLCIIAISLSHTYTWSFVVGAFTIFLIITIISQKRNRLESRRRYVPVLCVGLAIIISIAFDISKASLIGSLTGLESDAVVTNGYLDLGKFPVRWSNLQYTFNTFLGGFLTNTPMLVIALLWVIFKSDYAKTSDRIFLSSLFIGAIPILFGDYQIQSRIFYNMPIHMIAGIFTAEAYKGSSKVTLSLIIMIFVFLTFINVLFRSLANLIFIPPT